MALNSDGLIDSALPKDTQQASVNVGASVAAVQEAIAEGEAEITVPDGAMQVELYVVDGGALQDFTIKTGAAAEVDWLASMGPAVFGCSDMATIVVGGTNTHEVNALFHMGVIRS
jgi:hypothetical protein